MQTIYFAFHPGATAVDAYHARGNTSHNLVVNGLRCSGPFFNGRVISRAEKHGGTAENTARRIGESGFFQINHKLIHSNPAHDTVRAWFHRVRGIGTRVNTHRSPISDARHAIGVSERNEGQRGGLIGAVPQPV